MKGFAAKLAGRDGRSFRRDNLVFFGACRSLPEPKAFSAFVRMLFREDWVVYAKKPFGGPEHVLHYLARYTDRAGISNHRLVHVTDAQVSFLWKDYAHHSKRRIMTLTHEELLRRFLQHVVPRGFPHIRYFGLFANRRRGKLHRRLPRWSQLRHQPSAAVLTVRAPCEIVERLSVSELSRQQHRLVELLDSW